jgi:glutamate racemase
LSNFSSSKPIAIFDTGLGGLTVAAEIRKQLPHENLVFLCDIARVPHGSLSVTLIKRFSTECFNFLLEHDPKALVVACNAVSAVNLEDTAARLPIPVIGVIEPTARAAQKSTRNRKIGVIATKATVKRKAYEMILRQLDDRIDVAANGCPLLVPLVEEGWIEGEVPEKVVQHYLEPIIAADVDTLVLGCTHYEYFRDILQRFMGPQTTLINTPFVTAKELDQLLSQNNLIADTLALGGIQIFSSDVNDTLERVAQELFPADFAAGRASIQAAQIPQQSTFSQSTSETRKD